jgi:Domain of unknown function (DUF4331)
MVSHHISGPRAMAEPAADITDLFAFPSPEQSGRLVLVLNTLPFAPPSALFSDGLIYRFRLRPLTANPRQNPVPFTADGEEIVIDCVFSAPRDGAHPLTELILADYLIVDAAKPYAERGSFLEIELAARRGEDHRTCGGRAPNDDVMDTLFTMAGERGERARHPRWRRPADQACLAPVPLPGSPEPRPPRLPIPKGGLCCGFRLSWGKPRSGTVRIRTRRGHAARPNPGEGRRG